MNRLKSLLLYISLVLLALPAFAQQKQAPVATKKKPEIAPSYAWTAMQPLGLHQEATVDTLTYDYYRSFIPSEQSDAWACTGNLGAQGINMLYMQRPAGSQFFFADALSAWLPGESATRKFYNTRIPTTLISYNAGGGKENAQDRFQTVFSGNMGPKLQLGANVDYIYSKGSYNYQATNDLAWGLSGSYIGDRWEVQASWTHYNFLNKENGGITDDRYITDPAALQGGVSSISPKSIPTNLTAAHTKLVGGKLFLNNRYKVGYWHSEQIDDTTEVRTYIPVTSFIWTLNYEKAKHIFHDENAQECAEFFDNTYLNPSLSDDRTKYTSLSNTLGVSMLEGFHKYAKFGLAAYATYEMRRFYQSADTLPHADGGLTPWPEGAEGAIPQKESQNLLWVGAQLTKQRGSILTYSATGEIGVAGDAAGEVKVNGEITTRIPLFADTLRVTGFGSFTNLSAPYLLQNYISNHFIWHNDFGKERRVRFGGNLSYPRLGTHISVAAENVQNLLYFNALGCPEQHSGSVQVFSATLRQNLKAGILHWDNTVTYQTSSQESVLSLPKLAVYSNLYLQCRIATLRLQFGVNCDYYTRYYAPGYQPATASFYNQREVKLGNYPLMTVYANMKLSKVRFYVMMSHINQGWFGNDYFSLPHYPINPRRFQMGLSVDFAN